MEHDAVRKPSHYVEGRKFEPKDVIRDWGLNFNLGNAVKYFSRAGRKGDILEDLRKAQEYIKFEIEALEAERVHLCKNCSYDYPVCPAENDGDLRFGSGTGKDNVVYCKHYHRKGDTPTHPYCKCVPNPITEGKRIVIDLVVPKDTPMEAVIQMAIAKIMGVEE